MHVLKNQLQHAHCAQSKDDICKNIGQEKQLGEGGYFGKFKYSCCTLSALLPCYVYSALRYFLLHNPRTTPSGRKVHSGEIGETNNVNSGRYLLFEMPKGSASTSLGPIVFAKIWFLVWFLNQSYSRQVTGFKWLLTAE